ncbi:MAG: DNA polymerase III subunit delta [Chloroflexi bacterium RBG_13_51_52]|nr:MAG: DNA polymerase III subunit delta [Chloroflexi bacterium RBG_13_51_52]
MLYILIGEDDFSIRQELQIIKNSAGDPSSLLSNTAVLEGNKVTPEQLHAACETVPFLADKRLVIIEGLFEKFEQKRKNGKKKSSRNPPEADQYKSLSDAMKGLPPFTELVLIGGDIKATNPLLGELSAVARVKKFPLIKGKQLSQWAEQRVALHGKGSSISKEALDLLVRLVGSDLWTMANEIDKLVLFTGGRPIEEADVQAVVSNAQETSIFKVIDAVMESRVSLAQQLLQQLYKQGMAPAQILVMLSRQVRIIFQVREMRNRGRSRGDIQTRLGLTQNFIFQKAWEQADKYSPARLKDVYHKLLDADIAIKTGQYSNPDLVLDILVIELGHRGAVTT